MYSHKRFILAGGLTPDNIAEAVRALKQAHPYEEPAYEVFRIEAF